jgi:hypothetical protein
LLSFGKKKALRKKYHAEKEAQEKVRVKREKRHVFTPTSPLTPQRQRAQATERLKTLDTPAQGGAEDQGRDAISPL